MLPALVVALALQGAGRDLGSTGYAEIESPDALLQVGPWRAWLDSPGGELPFALEVAREGKTLTATIGNGEEKIAVPETRLEGGDIVFDMPHYDSKITAKIAPLGTKLDGEWKKRSGVDRWTTLKFHATAGAAPRFTTQAQSAARQPEGRWSAHFDKGEETGVLVLRKGVGSGIEGTFLIPNGDYRWLAGSVEGDRLRLSCFDGAHAFLFDATASAGGGWSGKFWSGDRWQDAWSGKLDPNAQLPDGFDAVHWKDGPDLSQLMYPDLDGRERSLGEPALYGRAIVIQLLGSWCPNCHDETAYLARLYDKYRDRGLSVIGLAFELTGDFARDSEQVRRMRDRHRVRYPILLAGLSDKEKASRAFPILDHVLAFPTTLFLHRDGRVHSLHSGFAGPGTKGEHDKLVSRFEAIVCELLAEADSGDGGVWQSMTAEPWRGIGESESAQVRFIAERSGGMQFECQNFLYTYNYPVRRCDPRGAGEVVVHGTHVRIHDDQWLFDRRTGMLLDVGDWGRRLVPASKNGALWIDGSPLGHLEDVYPLLKSPDPILRREATFFLPLANQTSSVDRRVDPALMLSDPDVQVRCTAAWACGTVRSKEACAGLLELTRSAFAGERREAARALRAIGCADASSALSALENDPDPLVREAAKRAN